MDTTAIYRAALGRRPDDWQRTLANDQWPQVLVAPTGSGKTAAMTLGWAAHRLRSPNSTPRRLVWCLPMRTLVDRARSPARLPNGSSTRRRIGSGNQDQPTLGHLEVTQT